MAKFPVVFDIETKHTFRERSDVRKLEVSVAAIYDYGQGKGYVFKEDELSGLFRLLENASYAIGFNSDGFDLPVLSSYYHGDIKHFSSFDILSDIKNILGFRLSLNDLVAATLGKKKSGHGLQAIELFKEGRIDELKQYCLDDVMLTKELFDYGVNTGEIHYINERGKMPIRVDWKKYKEQSGKSESLLTLPF